MGIQSLSRVLSSLAVPKKLKFSLTIAIPFGTSSSVENYWTHLQKNSSNAERTLRTIKAKLDTKCVSEVLHKCALDQPLLGLRFFIWAGLQPNYRHSSYMYSKACQLFDINRNPKLVGDVMEAYRVEGCMVSVKSFKVVLNLCRKANLADEGLWVLRKMKEFDCRPDTTAYNVVIGLFCDKGNMDVAGELMREMSLSNLYPDMITYISMIKGFCKVGRVEDACALFKVMREQGCVPNAVVYSALLDGACRSGNIERALELLLEMERESGSCRPNTVTYTSVIQNFCERGRLMEALDILDRMEANGCSPNRVTVSTLMRGLCTEGLLEEAYKLIDRIVAGGSVSDSECYSSLVLSLLRAKRVEEAEKLFGRMLASAVKPDGAASSTMIKALCLAGRVLDGYCLFNEIEKLGCSNSIDLDIYSILLSGLCEGSHKVEAAEVARLMIERKIQLKALYTDNIVKHLKNSGKKELISHLTAMGN